MIVVQLLNIQWVSDTSAQSVATSLAGKVLCQCNDQHCAMLYNLQIVFFLQLAILQDHIDVNSDLLYFIHKPPHTELL